jgi:Acetyltransferase (GNAT) family
VGELQVARAGELTGSELGRVREIYEQAFVPQLRVRFHELTATGPVDEFLVAIDDGEPVGFAALRCLQPAGWTFLRYYAIAAGRRNSGLGQRFWRRLTPAVQAAGWPARVTLEVEHPAHVTGPGEPETARARIAFWTRCGCELLPVARYAMPGLTEATPPEPMLLMASDPAAAIDHDEIARLVRAIYQQRYGLGPGHPLAAAALASIGER